VNTSKTNKSEQMPGRKFNGGDYRYGFNGKENDNEIKGEGNSVDFGARMYDSRLGRWFAKDPLEHKYPSLSTYAFVANMPTVAKDPDGKDIVIIGSKAFQKRVLATLSSLSDKSTTASNQICNAVASDRTLVIVETDGSIENAVKRGTQEYDVLTLNFESAEGCYTDKDGAVEKTPETVLIHEVAHFNSETTGQLLDENGYAYPNGGIGADEVNAVEVENQVRKEMGLDERTHYDGVKVSGKKLVESEKYPGNYSLKNKKKYAPTNTSNEHFDLNSANVENEKRLGKTYYRKGIEISKYTLKSKGASMKQTRIHDGNKNKK
jgi:RHS repeat-associated protein